MSRCPGIGSGVCRGGLSEEKSPGQTQLVPPVSNQPTRGNSWAQEPSRGRLKENVFKKGQNIFKKAQNTRGKSVGGKKARETTLWAPKWEQKEGGMCSRAEICCNLWERLCWSSHPHCSPWKTPHWGRCLFPKGKAAHGEPVREHSPWRDLHNTTETGNEGVKLNLGRRGGWIFCLFSLCT